MAELVNMADQFKGLPMEDLIGGPLMAVCKAQTKLAKSTAEYIKEIGMKEKLDEDNKVITGPDNKPVLETRQVDFSYIQPMQQNSSEREEDTNNTGDGHSLTQAKVDISAPLLAIVPIPALLIDDVEIEFNMEVKSSVQSKSSHDESVKASASFGWGPFSASVQGSVSSHNEQTRKSDNSAKYHVKVSAKQADTPEGLSKILDMLSKSITPHKVTPLPETDKLDESGGGEDEGQG